LVSTPLEASGISISDDGGDDDSSSTTIVVDVDLYTDSYPDETSWVVNAADGTPIASFDGNFDSKPGALIRTSVNLVAGSTYEFVISDSGADGICCGAFGDGRVDIKATLPSGEQVLIVAIDGQFDREFRVEFTIPTDGASAPTLAPELVDCKDSFPFCFGFLCKLGAIFCEATCDRCPSH
jgi:hypothetical protein